MLPEAMDHHNLETSVMVIPDNAETATNDEAHHELPEATGDTNGRNSLQVASLVVIENATKDQATQTPVRPNAVFNDLYNEIDIIKEYLNPKEKQFF